MGVAGLQAGLGDAKERLAERGADLKESTYRFELLQGAAARGEAELHAAVKARRDAQLVWSEQKRALEAKLQV